MRKAAQDRRANVVAALLGAAVAAVPATSAALPGTAFAAAATSAAASAAVHRDDPLAEWMAADIPVADGFDFPVGDADGGGSYADPAGRRHEGWYVATAFLERYALGIHPGEDWNGRGGGDTDFGQPVHAVAAGRVRHARSYPDPWGGIVVVEHLYYENHEKRRALSLYAHLSRIDVEPGADVARRAVVGAVGKDPGGRFPAHLHFELRSRTDLEPTFWASSNGWTEAQVRKAWLAPRDFIRARRTLPVPQAEELVLLVHHATYRMQTFRRGKAERRYEIALGQGRGDKRRRGDLKTPKGMYFVIHKHRGRFDGEYGAFFGGHWIKVNYPNPWDAARAAPDLAIAADVQERIRQAWTRRRPTVETTLLGGGIGFHGWAGEWSGHGGAHLSWGCVVMHNDDIRALFDKVPEGTMVVLF